MPNFPDLFLGHVKRQNDAERREMASERDSHYSRVRGMESSNDREISNLRDEESRVYRRQREEREEAEAKQRELRETQRRIAEQHAKDYSEMSEDNKDRVMRRNEVQNELFKDENARGSEEKLKSATRDVEEKIRMENRQKEVEAELSKRKQDAEKEKSKLNELKFGEAQNYSQKVDQVNSEHHEDMKNLMSRQDQAAIEGSQIRNHQAARDGALQLIEAQTRVHSASAYENQVNNRQKASVIKSLRDENELFYKNAIKLVSNVKAAVKMQDVPSFTAELIKSFILTCRTSSSAIQITLDSPTFEQLDCLDKERKLIAKKSIETLRLIKSILEKWSAEMELELNPTNVIKTFGSGNIELEKLINKFHKEIREIPIPQVTQDDFDVAMISNCAAIWNDAAIESTAQLQLQSGGSTAQNSIQY